MDYLVYKIIHIAGLIGLFSSIGGLVAADVNKPETLGKFIKVHGISLILLLVSGFAIQAKLQLPFTGWLIAKVLIWFLMGAALVILKRRLMPPGLAWALTIALGIIAATLAFYKPF